VDPLLVLVGGPITATNEYRGRSGRRSVGEELADELMRGTWDER
jgi:hypothetical protein